MNTVLTILIIAAVMLVIAVLSVKIISSTSRVCCSGSDVWWGCASRGSG